MKQIKITSDKMPKTIFELKNISQSFEASDGSQNVILEDINLSLREGEIIALLGKSGSGKSCLLKLIAGLTKKTNGEIVSSLKKSDTNFAMSMIFQNIALFPWLNVLENVEIGLKSLNLSAKEMKERAIDSINLTGLNGFESAYPMELSSGMRQRVGFARALVVRPEILLMDEPFSTLDILTANTLKTDFLELWSTKKTPLNAVLIVTHSIEEAVTIADRVIIMGSSPGRIVSEVKVNLPHPRNSSDPIFRRLLDEIYSKMSDAASDRLDPIEPYSTTGLDTILPYIYPNKLIGLMKAVIKQGKGGKHDIQELSSKLQLDISSLMQMVEALKMLDLAKIEDSEIHLTENGFKFALNDIESRKKIFGKLLIDRIPIVAHITNSVRDDEDHKITQDEVMDLLESHMRLSKSEAINILKAAILWGRYSNLFMFDDKKKEFILGD
ncbi:MAG: nitrate/sulfonate/bicarbonate ABC transporter ATP-binding protein [Rickettsiaceae bacterium]|nr:nitrate/sulfonate/bicarbonate ABC transporter ATP-binding protein [Rickettsiaceae bacterium]